MYFYEKKNYNISSHCLKTGSKHFFSLFLIHKRVLIIAHFAVDIGGGGAFLECITYIPTFLLLIHVYAHVCIYVCLGLEIG